MSVLLVDFMPEIIASLLPVMDVVTCKPFDASLKLVEVLTRSFELSLSLGESRDFVSSLVEILDSTYSESVSDEHRNSAMRSIVNLCRSSDKIWQYLTETCNARLILGSSPSLPIFMIPCFVKFLCVNVQIMVTARFLFLFFIIYI